MKPNSPTVAHSSSPGAADHPGTSAHPGRRREGAERPSLGAGMTRTACMTSRPLIGWLNSSCRHGRPGRDEAAWAVRRRRRPLPRQHRPSPPGLLRRGPAGPIPHNKPAKRRQDARCRRAAGLASPARVVLSRGQFAMPGQQRRGRDGKSGSSGCGGRAGPARRATPGRPAYTRTRLAWRRSTAFSCRSTSNLATFAGSPRNTSVATPRTRHISR
jgi:hypothetical protein